MELRESQWQRIAAAINSGITSGQLRPVDTRLVQIMSDGVIGHSAVWHRPARTVNSLPKKQIIYDKECFDVQHATESQPKKTLLCPGRLSGRMPTGRSHGKNTFCKNNQYTRKPSSGPYPGRPASNCRAGL
nr:hypothetical protein [Pelosinus fermentans]